MRSARGMLCSLIRGGRRNDDRGSDDDRFAVPSDNLDAMAGHVWPGLVRHEQYLLCEFLVADPAEQGLAVCGVETIGWLIEHEEWRVIDEFGDGQTKRHAEQETLAAPLIQAGWDLLTEIARHHLHGIMSRVDRERREFVALG